MLYHKPYGIDDHTKPILVIAHGLFGSSTNWHSMAGKFSSQYQVYNLDLRNHGRSPWQPTHDYAGLAEDIAEFISAQSLGKVSLLGHSMGGKAAMQLALTNSQLLEKLIVADIAPVSYPDREHADLIEAMMTLDLSKVSSRKEADNTLRKTIPSAAVRLFLLQNLVPDSDSNQWKWRLNLTTLLEALPDIMAFPSHSSSCSVPSLFVYGKNSDYVTSENQAITSELFSDVHFHGIEKAGHWLHAEQPADFYQTCIQFLNLE